MAGILTGKVVWLVHCHKNAQPAESKREKKSNLPHDRQRVHMASKSVSHMVQATNNSRSTDHPHGPESINRKDPGAQWSRLGLLRQERISK